MPRNYEDSYKLFTDYIEKQINSIKVKLKNIEYYNNIRNIYNILKGKDFSKFIENYDILSKVSTEIKENLDNIYYFIQNNITTISQMNEAMDNILSNNELLRIVGNNESKEMLLGKLEKLKSILSGDYEFDTFKNALLNSTLDDEDIITILTHEAEKVALNDKKELPSLEENNSKNNGILNRQNEIIEKINALLEKYYHLLESKPANMIELYKKTLSVTNIKEIDNIYSEKDVLVCLHLLNLINLKAEANALLNEKPIDYSLIEVNNEELIESYNLACEKVSEYEKELFESLPLDANVYFVLSNGKPLFDINSFNEEERKNISSLLKDLEMGLYDYERNKGSHTKVIQQVRKDLNVFVNKKRNTSISYLRINLNGLKDSKVLVLSIADFRNIFDKSKTVLKSYSSLIDDSISLISENNEAYIRGQEQFKASLEVGGVQTL